MFFVDPKSSISFKFFFNYSGDDFSTKIREEFRILPDEFVDGLAGISAEKDLKERPDLKKQVDPLFYSSYESHSTTKVEKTRWKITFLIDYNFR